MKLFFVQFSLSAILFISQFACKDNVTGYNNSTIENFYGQLSVDVVHSILRPDGEIWSWGFNGSGTLGNGTTQNSDLPVNALHLNNVISIDQSFGAEVAVDICGNIWFWGNIGIHSGPPHIDTNVVAPFKIAQIPGAKCITIYDVHIYVLREDYTVWYIQLDWYSPNVVGCPVLVEGVPPVSFLWKYLAVTVEGKIYNLSSRNYIQNTLTNIVTVSGNPSRHVLALRKDGTVWAWGNNELGQLGNGTYENSDLPKKALNLKDIIAISGNFDFNLALRKDGTVWHWGFEGQEGDSLFSQNTPVKIEQICDATLICSGYEGLIMTKDKKYWIFKIKDKILSVISLNELRTIYKD